MLSACSLAFILNDTILEFLGSISLIFPRLFNSFWKFGRFALDELKTGDAMNGPYDEIPLDMEGGVPIEVFPEFKIGAVIQGSKGREVPKVHEFLLDRELKGKLSLIFKLEDSNFSCRLHLARLFWNQT